MEIFVAPLALLLERLAGYPRPLNRLIGHPVMWMGALLAWLDRRLNRGGRRRLKGVLALALLLAACLAIALLVAWLTSRLPFGWVIEAVLATSLLAQVELGRAVKSVADGLGRSLAAGRAAVGHIVGRDTEVLDEPGVARAAIESLAESSSDGIVAPLFWMLIFGLPGIVLYKAINTADSMIGHKSERYLEFGWASAKLDDLVNWIPARLTALLIATAAFLVRGADPESALSAALRDAVKHDSPNAGWPEAAIAGALGLSLGGPRLYDGDRLELPSFGDGRAELNSVDILKALELYWMMLNVTLGICLAVTLVVWIVL